MVDDIGKKKEREKVKHTIRHRYYFLSLRVTVQARGKEEAAASSIGDDAGHAKEKKKRKENRRLMTARRATSMSFERSTH